MKEITAEEIVKMAMDKGSDSAEVYMKSSRGISAEAKNGNVEALEVSEDRGTSLKVIKNKRLGFAFTTDPDDIGKMIDEAVQAAEWTGVDEFMDIPELAAHEDVLMFDKNIKNIKEDDVISEALLLEESALSFDERIKRVRKAEAGSGTAVTTIVNSKGLNVKYESSYYSVYLTALAEDGNGDSQMGWDYAGSRRVKDIDVRFVGQEAARRAMELLGSRKISTLKAPVIFSPSVAGEFLDILSASISADAVQKQRSFLAGKEGLKIISPLVEIIDDGRMDWHIGTRPVDDEGVPTATKAIISEGVLNGYIHNTYTAKKGMTTSTGNAVRGGFKGLPGVGVMNCYIKPSDTSSDDLVKSLSKGIVVLGAMGVHTANPVSGDFSIGISGLWVENGEVAYPIKEAIISGNVLDLFNKVEAV
ncbi:MAG TPA: TldD/PmbA family protein, partial [Nitrospirae bacterium]|nr:TldD/PmbA family protein [Nitrospirota bacterium]